MLNSKGRLASLISIKIEAKKVSFKKKIARETYRHNIQLNLKQNNKPVSNKSSMRSKTV